jgi:hypothetical protein
MKTKPEVFIIESLDFSDERRGHFEGQIIKQILALSNKRCKYYYIRTERELAKVLEIFTASNYRYLHLSCHGNKKSMATTLDSIRLPRLAALLTPHLAKRRLFVSACSMTNESLASLVMPNSGCHSIVGPAEDILFSDAAILWSSLYHVMFASDSGLMKRRTLKSKTQEVANMYRVRMKVFASASDSEGYEAFDIRPKPDDAA